MYMIPNDMSPDIMSEIFKLKENTHYHLRLTSEFKVHLIHCVYNGSKPVSYLGLKTLELIPLYLKAIESLAVFKEKKIRNRNL